MKTVVTSSTVMLEASAENLSQQDFQKCLKEGVKRTQPIIQALKQMQELYGKAKRDVATPLVLEADIELAVARCCYHPY